MKCYQNTRNTIHSKPNVVQTIVIIVFYIKMLSEPMENNTFHPQSVRNQCNNTNVNLHMLKYVLFHYFLTLCDWNVLFFIGSGYISIQHVIITLVSEMLGCQCVVFSYVLITCHSDMLPKHKENNTFQMQCVVFLVFW